MVTARMTFIHGAANLSRRGFLRRAGRGAFALGTGALWVRCGDGGVAEADPDRGEIAGTVTDLDGNARDIGQIYFMSESGLLDGRVETVDSDGRFRFANVEPGEYQLRFHAPRVARVPPNLPHPIRVQVSARQVTEVTVNIEMGVYNENMIEIYAGDNFFQEQPVGQPNAMTTVRLGVVVCWYNVGKHDHVVAGGPWGSSPRLHPSDAFIWKADQLGVLPYECTYHLPDMRSSLRVVEE